MILTSALILLNTLTTSLTMREQEVNVLESLSANISWENFCPGGSQNSTKKGHESSISVILNK